ncbi:hypothetical protein D3C75_1362600 [compost metagenome]
MARSGERGGMQRHHTACVIPFPLAALQHRTDGRGHLLPKEQEQRRVMDAAAAITLAALRFFLHRKLFCIM